MDKKTTPSFSSSSVKPGSADNALPDDIRSLPGKLWIFFVTLPVIIVQCLSFRKACRV